MSICQQSRLFLPAFSYIVISLPGVGRWKYTSPALLPPPPKPPKQRRRPSPTLRHPASHELEPNSLVAPTPPTPPSPLGAPKAFLRAGFPSHPLSPPWADSGALAPSKHLLTHPWLWWLRRDQGMRVGAQQAHAFTENSSCSFLFQRNMSRSCVSLILALPPPAWSFTQHRIQGQGEGRGGWDVPCSGLLPSSLQE